MYSYLDANIISFIKGWASLWCPGSLFRYRLHICICSGINPHSCLGSLADFTVKFDIFYIFTSFTSSKMYFSSNFVIYLTINSLCTTITDCYRLLRTITDYYRLLQTITDYYRLLHTIAYSYILLHTVTYYYRLLQIITDYHRQSQTITD